MDLAGYAKLVLGKHCILCEKVFTEPITIEYYTHTQGWLVEGFTERQWLYITCFYCRYQNALWKLGIKGGAYELLQYPERTYLLH